MKNSRTRKSKHAAPVVVAAEPRTNPWMWIYAAGLVIALFAAFEVYWPAIHGPFLLDDTHLTYMQPDAADIPLRAWVSQLRPLLMFSYWLNYQQSGAQNTFGYHAFNVLLHFLNAVFIFLAVRKVLNWAGVEETRARILSFFAAGLFLLHPVQTESVSYIASRSETLSVFFVLAAFVVYLYRKTDVVSIPRILALLALFVAAALSKEHTVVLPALFILTDYYWNFEFAPSVIWRNWKLYVPIAAGALLALLGILRILRGNQSAGFQIQGLAWYEYFFTECRVIWDYIRLFVFPFGQNLDPDIEISREHHSARRDHRLGWIVGGQHSGLDLPAPLSDRILRMVRVFDSARAYLVLCTDLRSHGGTPDVPAVHRALVDHRGVSAALERIEERIHWIAGGGLGRRRRHHLSTESVVGQCDRHLERYSLQVSPETAPALSIGVRRISSRRLL